jgi:hypothetical protein
VYDISVGGNSCASDGTRRMPFPAKRDGDGFRPMLFTWGLGGVPRPVNHPQTRSLGVPPRCSDMVQVDSIGLWPEGPRASSRGWNEAQPPVQRPAILPRPERGGGEGGILRPIRGAIRVAARTGGSASFHPRLLARTPCGVQEPTKLRTQYSTTGGKSRRDSWKPTSVSCIRARTHGPFPLDPPFSLP